MHIFADIWPNSLFKFVVTREDTWTHRDRQRFCPFALPFRKACCLKIVKVYSPFKRASTSWVQVAFERCGRRDFCDIFLLPFTYKDTGNGSKWRAIYMYTGWECTRSDLSKLWNSGDARVIISPIFPSKRPRLSRFKSKIWYNIRQ